MALTYIRDVPSAGRRRALFLCDCGREHEARYDAVKGGGTVSCGHTHGGSGTALWRAWYNMIQRTTPGGSAQRRKPGYVGVQCCESWQTFESFAADMSIDRENRAFGVDGRIVLGRYRDRGNYTRENARWQTVEESGRESAEPRMLLTSDGLFAADVARDHGLTAGNVRSRVWLGWPLDMACVAPLGVTRKMFLSGVVYLFRYC